MKSNERIIQHSQVQKQRNYQKHLERIDTIAAARRNKSKSSSLDISNFHAKKFGSPRHSHGVSLFQQKRIKMENQRLMKRLNEIGKRKQKFSKITKDEENYVTLNLKSRDAYRRQKVQMIQEQNDLFVERLVSNLNHRKSIKSEMQQSGIKQSKKRKKTKKKSYMFAAYEKQGLDENV